MIPDESKAAQYDAMITSCKAQREAWAKDFATLTSAEQQLATAHAFCVSADNSCSCVADEISGLDGLFNGATIESLDYFMDFSEFNSSCTTLRDGVSDVQDSIVETMQSIDAAQTAIGEKIKELNDSISSYQYLADYYRGYYGSSGYNY